MALTFCDLTRTFDQSELSVRFSGQDSFMRASFVVTFAALIEGIPLAVISESSLLVLFDRRRGRFQAQAAMAYRRGWAGPYILTA